MSSEGWQVNQNIQEKVHIGRGYEEWVKIKNKSHFLDWNQNTEEVNCSWWKKKCKPVLKDQLEDGRTSCWISNFKEKGDSITLIIQKKNMWLKQESRKRIWVANSGSEEQSSSEPKIKPIGLKRQHQINSKASILCFPLFSNFSRTVFIIFIICARFGSTYINIFIIRNKI